MSALHAMSPGYALLWLVLSISLVIVCDRLMDGVIAEERASHDRGQAYLMAILNAPTESGYVWAERVDRRDPDMPGGLYAKDQHGNTYTLAGPGDAYDVWSRLQRAGIVVHLSAPKDTPVSD